jgi:hypothetical protein
MSDLPVPADSDSENVVWLLSTAASLWTKGERPEALRWLERAANAARDEGATTRAVELLGAIKKLGPSASPAPSQDAMKKAFQRTMQSKPASIPATAEGPPRVEVRNPPIPFSPPPMSVPAETRVSGIVSEPPEVLSSSDLTSDLPESASTRRFDYPEALEQLAKPSQPTAATTLPNDVLPAIRVWIVAGRVVPATGARPTGAADAILLAVVPGVDLASLLANQD